MDTALPVVSIVLAVVAVSVAVWQGLMARSQLDLAEQTNGETGRALAEIKELVRETRELTQETRSVSSELKTAFDDKIGKIFDQYVTTLQRRADSEHDRETKSNDMADKALKSLGQFFQEGFAQARREREAAEAAEDAALAEQVLDDSEDPAP